MDSKQIDKYNGKQMIILMQGNITSHVLGV